MAKVLAVIVATLLIAMSHADARSSHGRVYGFRTGHCKTSSCYSKHRSGTYVHPLTRKKH